MHFSLIIFLKEIMAENFPKLGKKADSMVQEAQSIPNKMNPKRPHQDMLWLKWQKLKIKR